MGFFLRDLATNPGAMNGSNPRVIHVHRALRSPLVELAGAFFALVAGCGSPPPATSPSAAVGSERVEALPTFHQSGVASWYGDAFAGKRTSSGERFDPRQFTAAHKTLPFGTWVEVVRSDSGRKVRVRINDRGPNGHAKDRIINLSRRAAEEVDLVGAGVAHVEIRVVDGP